MAQMALETIVVIIILVIVAVTMVILFTTGVGGNAGNFLQFSNQSTGSLYDRTQDQIGEL